MPKTERGAYKNYAILDFMSSLAKVINKSNITPWESQVTKSALATTKTTVCVKVVDNSWERPETGALCYGFGYKSYPYVAITLGYVWPGSLWEMFSYGKMCVTGAMIQHSLCKVFPY